MKVLVIGSGGREHSMAWKIAQNKEVEKIYCAPGNAGTALLAENVAIKAEDINALADFAEKNSIDLTLVGPEAPLVEGIVDEFEKRNLKVFGPTAKAARLEGSKVFAKQIMQKYGVPTAECRIFDSTEKALKHIAERSAPMVVKADGLAAGKGVIICKTKEEAVQAVKQIMEEKVFGKAGNRIIIEDCLFGEEASVIGFSDGKTVKLLVSSQDHKPAYDNDLGENTGGMGAYAPAPIISEKLKEKIMQQVMLPTIQGMKKEGIPFKGILYAGLMVSGNELNVLEFNVRLGDPETQVILPLMKSDLIKAAEACINGTLNEFEIESFEKAACCVVLASGGYPKAYEKGKEILGLEEAGQLDDVMVFHAGTKNEEGKVLSSGGRVLGVTALGLDIKEAISKSYEAVSKISFEKMHFRKDIGLKGLKRIQ